MTKKILPIILLVFSVIELRGECFDMSNLNSSNIICTTGSFTNPYQMTGVVSGRHTVMSNTRERDANVVDLLIVPPGEKNSIRLGNSQVGAEAESITFFYNVNSDNSILILKYAAVMQDPGHDASSQPRLRLEILNSSGGVINPECTYFDFIASPSLGWNSTNNGELLWKDWTCIGVDLSSYIGQEVQIRLTNYDCSQSGHYGYAYFHLACTNKQIKSKACGDVPSVTFTAPSGFKYYWYTELNGAQIPKGTGQSVTVPMDGTKYFCTITQIGKPECSYTTNVIAQPRYPIADFNIQHIRGCIDTLFLNNTSSVSLDGITKNSPIESCDEAIWDLGDGRILTDYQLKGIPISYDKAGTYNITLTTILKDGNCNHTISKRVTINGGINDKHESIIHAAICENSFYRFNGQNLTNSGVYTQITKTASGCDSTTILYLTVNPSVEYTDTLYLCKNTKYNFHGQTITHSGTYYAKYKNIYGCDSVYKLVVNEVPTYYHEDEITICDKETYNFNGRILQKSGTYIDSTQSVYGCDSIIKLILHVNKSYLYDTYIETCHSDTFLFRNQVIDHSGIYYDSLYTHQGCDSIYRLIYNIVPTYQFYSEATIFQGESYSFHGHQFTDSGLHTVTYRTSSGCDSTYRLQLHVLPKYVFKEQATICDTTQYIWRGKTLYSTGVYYDSLRTIAGHDSIYILDLTVNKSYLIPIQITTCIGESFHYKGKTFVEPGIYYDSLLTTHGCDSIIKIIYNINPTYLYKDTAFFCLNTPYNFRGKLLTSQGIYYDTLKTINGCDSIYELTLYAYDNFTKKEEITICENEPYLWRGRHLSIPGIYADTFQTTNGCDSIYLIKLNVLKSHQKNKYVNLCPNESFVIKGHKLYAPNVYLDTIISSVGCDSIIRYIIANDPNYVIEKEAIMCPNDSYNFRGRILNGPGTFFDTLQTITGCDSTYKLTLKTHPKYLYIKYDTVNCTNIPYTWRDKKYSTSGIFVDSLVASNGCDSIFTLNLTVNNSYIFITKDTICDFQHYHFRNNLYNTTGVFYDSLVTSAGCDSVFELDLVVHKSKRDTIYNEICLGDTIEFGQNIITESGIYYDTICQPFFKNCNLITMIVTTFSPTDLYYANINDVCADDSLIYIDFRYRGSKPTTYSLYYDQAAKIQGFRDVIKKTYNGTITDQVPLFSGKSYIKPDKYNVTLELDNGICSPASYRINIPFLIRYPSWIIEQNWNDVVALLNSNYNGGYTFSEYQWYINERLVEYATNSILYSQEIGVGDEIFLSLKRSNENYFIPTCPIIIEGTSTANELATPILVYPNNVSFSDPLVHVLPTIAGEYYIYNAFGVLLSKQKYTNIGLFDIQLPPIKGLYIIKFICVNEDKKTIKVLVH